VVADEAITVSSAESCLGEDVKHLSAVAAGSGLNHSALPWSPAESNQLHDLPCLLVTRCAVGQQGAGHEAWPDSTGNYG
jgi:hypothetical protein